MMMVGCIRVVILYNSSSSSWNCHYLSEQPLPQRAILPIRAGSTDRPSQYKSPQMHEATLLQLSRAARRAVPALYSLWPLWLHPLAPPLPVSASPVDCLMTTFTVDILVLVSPWSSSCPIPLTWLQTLAFPCLSAR